MTFESPTGAMVTWARHQIALTALAEVLRVLEPARIPVLAVKGIVLAYALHDDVARAAAQRRRSAGATAGFRPRPPRDAPRGLRGELVEPAARGRLV